MTRNLPAIALLTLLAACHGDNGPDRNASRPDTAEGLWSGVFSISADASANSRSFQALVTPGGQIWMTYTQENSSLLGGLVQGSGSSDSGVHRYTAASVAEHDANGNRSGPLSAQYVAQSKLGGTLTTTRTLSFNPAHSVNYNLAYHLDQPALPADPTTLSALGLTPAGSADVSLALDRTASDPAYVLNGGVGPSGSFCLFHGPATPSTAGNYFNARLTFLAGPNCDNLGLGGTLGGVLFRSSAGKWVLVSDGAVFGLLEK